MNTVFVEASSSYYVKIGAGLVSSIGEEIQKLPANKGQVQAEQLALVAIHQLTGSGDGFVGCHLRMLGHDIGGHGIAIDFDDAGNDEQQAPQSDVQIPKKSLQETLTKLVKLGKEGFAFQLLAIVLIQQELGVA